MRIHFRSNLEAPYSTVGWFAQLISSSLLSETEVPYDLHLSEKGSGKVFVWTFPPSNTRALTEHGDGTWTYEERYTFGDRVDIIHFALAFGWTSSLEDDCLTYPPLGELLP